MPPKSSNALSLKEKFKQLRQVESGAQRASAAAGAAASASAAQRRDANASKLAKAAALWKQRQAEKSSATAVDKSSAAAVGGKRAAADAAAGGAAKRARDAATPSTASRVAASATSDAATSAVQSASSASTSRAATATTAAAAAGEESARETVRVHNDEEGGYEEIDVEFVPGTVFVSGLPPFIEEHDLQGAFQRLGAIEHLSVVPDRNFAFVRFYDKSLVERCVAKMNGADLGGHTLRVTKARSRLAKLRDEDRLAAPDDGSGVRRPPIANGPGGPNSRHRWVDLDSYDTLKQSDVYGIGPSVEETLPPPVRESAAADGAPRDAAGEPGDGAPPPEPEAGAAIDYGFEDMSD